MLAIKEKGETVLQSSPADKGIVRDDKSDEDARKPVSAKIAHPLLYANVLYINFQKRKLFFDQQRARVQQSLKEIVQEYNRVFDAKEPVNFFLNKIRQVPANPPSRIFGGSPGKIAKRRQSKSQTLILERTKLPKEVEDLALETKKKTKTLAKLVGQRGSSNISSKSKKSSGSDPSFTSPRKYQLRKATPKRRSSTRTKDFFPRTKDEYTGFVFSLKSVFNKAKSDLELKIVGNSTNLFPSYTIKLYKLLMDCIEHGKGGNNNISPIHESVPQGNNWLSKLDVSIKVAFEKAIMDFESNRIQTASKKIGNKVCTECSGCIRTLRASCIRTKLYMFVIDGLNFGHGRKSLFGYF